MPQGMPASTAPFSPGLKLKKYEVCNIGFCCFFSLELSAGQSVKIVLSTANKEAKSFASVAFEPLVDIHRHFLLNAIKNVVMNFIPNGKICFIVGPIPL